MKEKIRVHIDLQVESLSRNLSLHAIPFWNSDPRQ